MFIGGIKLKKFIIVISISVSIISLLVFGIIRFNDQEPVFASEDMELYEVSTQEVNNSKLIPGIIAANDTIDYYFELSLGQNYALHVKKGDIVNEGDLLYTYDNPDLTYEKKSLNLQKKICLIRI